MLGLPLALVLSVCWFWFSLSVAYRYVDHQLPACGCMLSLPPLLILIAYKFGLWSALALFVVSNLVGGLLAVFVPAFISRSPVVAFRVSALGAFLSGVAMYVFALQ